MGLQFERSASGVESDGSEVGKAAKMQEALFLQAISECGDFPSFTKRSYPCWVISLTRLRSFEELPEHEVRTSATRRSRRIPPLNSDK